jgi:hypothetical protein
MCKSSFQLQSHENQFPIVGFLAKQILGIPGSQIKIERVLNLVGVLIALQCYCLQVENLDHIIMVVKNWPNDRQLNCTPTIVLKIIWKLNVF